MKCPECMKQNKTSCVYLGSCTQTLAHFIPGYWDENGKWESNKEYRNRITQEYKCSNGHSWSVIE